MQEHPTNPSFNFAPYLEIFARSFTSFYSSFVYVFYVILRITSI